MICCLLMNFKDCSNKMKKIKLKGEWRGNVFYISNSIEDEEKKKNEKIKPDLPINNDKPTST